MMKFRKKVKARKYILLVLLWFLLQVTLSFSIQATELEEFESLIEDSEEDVRQHALEEWSNLELELEEKIPYLLKFLADESDSIRWQARKKLSEQGSEVIPLLEEKYETADRVVCLNIIKAMGNMGSKEAVSHLKEVLEDNDPEFRRQAVLALEKIVPDDQKVKEKLVALIGDRNETDKIRKASIKALENVGLENLDNKQMMTALFRAIDSGNQGLVFQASSLLNKLETGEVVDHLNRVLVDEEVQIEDKRSAIKVIDRLNYDYAKFKESLLLVQSFGDFDLISRGNQLLRDEISSEEIKKELEKIISYEKDVKRQLMAVKTIPALRNEQLKEEFLDYLMDLVKGQSTKQKVTREAIEAITRISYLAREKVEEFLQDLKENEQIDSDIREIASENLDNIDGKVENIMDFNILRKRVERELLSDEVEESQARQLSRDMNLSSSEEIWEYEYGHPNQASGIITDHYKNIFTMARAYRQSGDEELKQDILAALDWMYENLYNEGEETYANWWHWEIGGPMKLVDIVILMYEDMSSDQINNNMDTVANFLYEDYLQGEAVGANLMDTAIIDIKMGLVLAEEKNLERAREIVISDLKYVESGSGFHEDGSYIYHGNMPYNGTYFLVMIGGMLEVMDLLSDSPWEIRDESYDEIMYDWVAKGLYPLFYNGEMMQMVMGRRHKSNRNNGKWALQLSEEIAERVNQPYSDKIQELLNTPIETEKIHHQYKEMDRIVHHGDNYAFGLSMFSPRIKTHATDNGENITGWYLSSGMTYLYNRDKDHYENNYWPTVDWYRLPGITVETMTRTNSRFEGMMTNSHDWVGGTSLEKYGVAGMELEQWNSTLYAKKSWFMFDDEIVALGADINKRFSDNSVETIIDNRRINQKGDNQLMVNDREKPTELGHTVSKTDHDEQGVEVVYKEKRTGWKEKMEQVDWIYLEGNDEQADIAYYFPGQADVKGLREARTGSWADVNFGDSDSEITRNFITLWFDHGENPKNDTYEYVVMPNKNAKETKEYSENPEISIVKNSPPVQAVRQEKLNILAANFWTDEKTEVDILTVDKTAAVLLQEGKEELKFSIAEPTRKKKEIKVKINCQVEEVVSQDERIKILELDSEVIMKIDVAGADGKDIKAVFSK